MPVFETNTGDELEPQRPCRSGGAHPCSRHWLFNAGIEVVMHQERLNYLETIIAGKQRNFYELGKALNEIKQTRLYRLAL